MERRVTGNCHARCEAGEKREITSNSYLSLYEVRSFIGWYRHITLVMLAFLGSIASAARNRAHAPLPRREPPADLVPADLWPLSVPEARHLLACLLLPPPSSVTLVIEWSAWRGFHQRLASFFHTRRRVKAGSLQSHLCGDTGRRWHGIAQLIRAKPCRIEVPPPAPNAGSSVGR